MSKFPVVTSKRLVRYLKGHGFKERKRSGSPVVLECDGVARPLVIPMDDVVSVTTVKRILKTAKISEKDFRDAMQDGKKSR